MVSVWPTVFISIIAGLITGLSMSFAWRWRSRAHAVLVKAAETSAMLEAMERSHDPGRDVHERLAAAIEPTLIWKEGVGDPPSRRATAMMMAAGIIETIERANLVLTEKEP